jgi:two-component sensor histidine kinase
MTSVARFASSLEKLTGESPWKPYAFAVAAIISALLLRELLVFTTGMNLVAALFLPAVMVTGLACGLLPGLFAAALATFVSFIHLAGGNDVYFPSSPSIANAAVMTGLNVFLAVIAASHRGHRKRIELAMREVSHRTKNLLSVIISITSKIARSTNDISVFREELTSRLHSIAAAHDLLVNNQWSDMELSSVVAQAVAPFGDHQIEFDGPRVMVTPVMVENIMMGLYELLTNSAKYGVLSPAGGKIRIQWSMEAGRLHFDWEGIVARDFEPASREGFGTEILTKAVPKNLGGHAVYEVKDGRVLWTLDVPLRQ